MLFEVWMVGWLIYTYIGLYLHSFERSVSFRLLIIPPYTYHIMYLWEVIYIYIYSIICTTI